MGAPRGRAGQGTRVPFALRRALGLLLLGTLLGCPQEEPAGFSDEELRELAGQVETAQAEIQDFRDGEADRDAIVAGALEDAGVYEDWYPVDITPPAGTQYPCALTALPRELPGIPSPDRRYINHAYSMILQATQAKLPLLQRVWDATAGVQVDLPAELEVYTASLDEARAKLEAESVPRGLEGFHGKILQALELQRAFFAKAVADCQARADQAGIPEGRETSPLWDRVIAIPEGKQASGLLIGAWGDMQRRYPEWTPSLKDSVYHHLCALDLF